MNHSQDVIGMIRRKSFLALAEFSEAGINAVGRAGLLAREHGARLTLLHGVSSIPGQLSARAAVEAARAKLEQMARRLRARLGVRVGCRVIQGDLLREAAHAARGADLLVLGSRRNNALREFLMGTAAERWIRLARIPVLVVKREAAHAYRRVLVPVQFGDHSQRAVAMALGMSQEAQVEVFHALRSGSDISLRATDVPELILRRYRNLDVEQAQARMDVMIRQAGGASRGVFAGLGFGDAAALALQREAATAAQLVVIGKRHHSLLADFLLGIVTQRLLAESRADVLVMPAPRWLNGSWSGTRRLAGLAALRSSP